MENEKIGSEIVEEKKVSSWGDTHSYKWWLNSDSFLKRAFAIYGYSMVAAFIILIPFYIVMFIIMFAVWMWWNL